MEPGKKRVLIVAGEASGDLHGAKVAEALLRLDPEIQVSAMGGNYLRKAGAQLTIDSSKLAVVGITEVLGRMGGILRAYRHLKKALQRREVDLLILIDFPDFNLPLARVAKESGVPVLYYISPQVWAWRSGRMEKIARRVNRMAVIFPFEVPLYQGAGLKAEFVGHPLMDILEPVPGSLAKPSRENWKGDPLIALLPGSREKEVKSLLPAMIRAAEILTREKPGASFLVALAPTLEVGQVGKFLPPHHPPITLVEGMTHEAIRAADLIIVASGTATLEAAILQKPMIIVYRVSPLSYLVGRAMIKVKWIGLVNLIAGKAIVPELIQGEVKGERIAQEAARILEDEKYRCEMIGELAEVSRKLGAPGAAERVARMALDLLKGENFKAQNPNAK